MDGTRLGSQYIQDLPHSARRRKIQVIGSNKIENVKKHQYYESNNPYSLFRNGNTPYTPRNQVSHDNFSNRDTLTQTSSQKSAKIIRTNGLTKAQKPNLSTSKAIRPIINRTNHSKIPPAFSPTPHQQPNPDPNQNPQHHNPQSRIQPQPPKSQHYTTITTTKKLQQQNTILKQQNMRLLDHISKMQRNHYQEIKGLKQQLERVFRMAAELEGRVNQQDREWERFCKEREGEKQRQRRER